MSGILNDLLRTLGFFLDNIVYGLIPQIYKLFIYLSQINFFGSTDDQNVLQDLINHIYVLLGIFMLFKVSFSLLQYLVDPNAFRDSSKGIGKLVTNVLVALVLLVSVPSIFSAAMYVQTQIIQSNAIGQLILGTNTNGEGSPALTADGKISPEGVEEMAKDLQFMVFGAFYSLNLDSDKVVGDAVTQGPLYPCHDTSGVLGSVDVATEQCLEAIQGQLDENDDALAYGVDLFSFFKHRESPDAPIEDDREFSHFDKLLGWKIDGEYVIRYFPFISTAAGIYIVLLLISFSIDIAVRAIKLCFLQMIAPIAIVSYIDPKESIGSGKLHGWIKECASTYFSLFLRLATVFLVMLLVSLITSSVLADGVIDEQITDSSYSIWIYLFLVIGAFMFAKQLPKILENIFGMKGTGNLSLNPIKSINEVISTPVIAAGGAAIGGAVGGMAANAIAAGKQFYDNRVNIKNGFRNGISDMKSVAGSQHMTFGNKVRTIAGIAGGGVLTAARGAARGAGTVAAGGVSGGARGAHAGYTNKNIVKGATTGRKEATEARNERDIRQAAGYGLKDQIGDSLANYANIKNKSGGVGAMDQQVKQWSNEMENAKVREKSMRDAQANMVAATKYTTDDMKKAMFAPVLDKNGNQMVDRITNQPVWDTAPEKIRTYDEYKKDALDRGVSELDLIDRDFYNQYSTTEKDALLADQSAESYKKAIKDYQDVMDIDKKGKK